MITIPCNPEAIKNHASLDEHEARAANKRQSLCENCICEDSTLSICYLQEIIILAKQKNLEEWLDFAK